MIDIAVNAMARCTAWTSSTTTWIQIDPATGRHGRRLAGVQRQLCAGHDFDEESGVLFWAAYSSSGELRVIGHGHGASSPIGGFPAARRSTAWPSRPGGDHVWLSEDPVDGTLRPDGGTVTADVTFDASVVTQPASTLAP